ncbi:MAG: hypothetical protein AAF518_17630 [Spirochaetota bacterium]
MTEKEMMDSYSNFHYVGKKILKQRLKLEKEKESIINSYDKFADHQNVLRLAKELSADFLLLGKTKIVRGREVMGSGIYSIDSTIEYKILDAVNGKMIANTKRKGSYPHSTSPFRSTPKNRTSFYRDC